MQFNKSQLEGFVKIADNLSTACVVAAIVGGIVDHKRSGCWRLSCSTRLRLFWRPSVRTGEKEKMVAIESLVGLVVFVIIFGAIGTYAKKHEMRPPKK